jgi:hypothetical protein
MSERNLATGRTDVEEIEVCYSLVRKPDEATF